MRSIRPAFDGAPYQDPLNFVCMGWPSSVPVTGRAPRGSAGDVGIESLTQLDRARWAGAVPDLGTSARP
jgi:hypothetical protein